MAGFWAWSFLAMFLLGAAAFFVAPSLPRDVAAVLRRRPGASLLAGLAVLIVVPLAIFAFALAVIGIPLAIVAVAIYVALFLLSTVFVSYRLGDWVLARVLHYAWTSRWAPLAMGALTLSFLMALPKVGAIASVLVITWGIGAIALERRARRGRFDSAAPRAGQPA